MPKTQTPKKCEKRVPNTSLTPPGSKKILVYRPLKPLKGRLGTRVRIAREAAGLTQLALAHAMGYKGEDAGALISRIESGVEEPRLAKLAKLAKALGVSMESLLNPA